MFCYLEVDGFRSLVNFKLAFRPGLNLFVGPNGSGKTNVISFLGFICDAALLNLSEAIGNLGGSGTVFRKHGEKKYHSQIKVKLRGRVEPTWEVYPGGKRPEERKDGEILNYEYAFTIQLSEDRESVYFARQSLKLHIRDKSISLAGIGKWDADISVEGNPDGSVSCTKCELATYYTDEIKRYEKVQNSKEFIEERSSPESSVISLAFPLLKNEFALALIKEFQKRIVFNPHPTQIRISEDSAKSPGIHPDGSGLYASLLALKRNKQRPSSRYLLLFGQPVIPFAPRIKLDRLIEFFQLAYPTMTKLAVTNDQFENTIRVRVTLDGKDKPQIPLAALSDGTLKWMSFVTAIFTNDALLAIEEPENFVHPTIQREAVRIARDQTHNNSLILMSSHSETILNSAEPEEIVVISIKGGRTYARRVRSPERLKELINESGFGLGFYYLSGALEDA